MKLIFLSAWFYEKHRGCAEILKKPTRPYVCLSVKVDGLLFAIPFRHHISHKYAFITEGQSGLDYTKAVLIQEGRDISDIQPWINQKSFNAIKGKEDKIRDGMRKFLNLYRKARNQEDNPHYSFILRCTALKHFDEYI